MTDTILITIIYVALIISADGNLFAYSHTRGYIKKSGAYVAPHYKTNMDRSKLNNWSGKGNINPMTGKRGYKKP